MKKVIITGAGGFVGSELTRKMVENGVGVIAVSLEFGENFPESPLITKIMADVGDENELLGVIPDGSYDAFYHLAWIGVNGHAKSDPKVQLENAAMATNCAGVAKKLGCGKFLCAGTVAENAVKSLPSLSKVNGGMVYGVAKYCTRLMLETYCKSIGQEFVWMQFSNAYGPQNKTGNLVSYTLGEILNGREATFGPACQPYDLIFVDDLLEAVYRLGFCKTSRNFYTIGSGKPRILKDYLLEIGRICDKERLIKIGARPDDGIVYTEEMFDCAALKADIGDYVSMPFGDGIKYTVENY